MKTIRLRPLALAMAALLYSSATLQVAFADDTEIYVPKEVPADQQVRPNILFVLDSSGSMTNGVPGTQKDWIEGNRRQPGRWTEKTRQEVMHEVVQDLIDSLKAQGNTNIGFMRYGGVWDKDIRNWWGFLQHRKGDDSNERGGHIIYPIRHLSNDTEAETMKSIVRGVNTSDWTPLLETYYEAYLYLTGQAPLFSYHRNNNRNHPNAMNGNKFDSPINHSCQKTHIIYITDGEPTRDVEANQLIKSLVQDKNTLHPASSCATGDNAHGHCLPHLAEYMANNDMALQGDRTTKPFSDPTGRMQTITSHFIGFALDLDLLKVAAEAGGGSYYTSDNVSGLVDALQSIIVDITAANTTFVAPSIAVTAYNNFGFRDELYYALFRPAEGTDWIGNIKKYRLKSKDADGNPITPVIVDRNGTQAIDADTGFFKTSSASYWSDIIDGDDVGRGGFAATLNPSQRKIYTWYGDDLVAGSDAAASALKTLYDGNNYSAGNNITNAMLGVNNTTTRELALNWLRGKKADGTDRKAIGDVLHNEPRLIAYRTDENIERAESAKSQEDITIFVGTNEGFIHALDAKTGQEKFAFIPKELLHIPNQYRKNDKGYNNKAYGMDGYFTALTEYGERQANDTRNIKKANLYAGMRRGGSNYYALDVLNLNEPKLKWVIKGAYRDTYRNDSDIFRAEAEITPGFEKLGLTFSAAKLGKIKVSSASDPIDVLVFSGGYDIQHDEAGDNTPKNDNIGNALYIVNAETGELLWRAAGTDDSDADLTLAAMTNSMPASPTLIDTNGDGLINIIYASDLRGQLFRFDIESGSLNNINGHLFAKLGGEDKANNRRFFNSPDVALIRDKGQPPFFTISIGSGFRASPLNEETDDRFYMIRDPYVTQSRSALDTPPVITESDLTDVSGLDNDAANANAVYEKVAELQNQIDTLEVSVQQKQQAFEAYKESIGYTAHREEYLARQAESNDLQRDIDGITLGAYPDFDADNYQTDKHYNSGFLVQHAAETQAQAELQAVVVAMQEAVAQLHSNNQAAAAVQLASYYEGLLNLQSSLSQHSSTLIEKENFILKGHAQPDLTPELVNEINTKFPGVIQDFSTSGDFSDLASQLSTAVQLEYQTHESSPDSSNRLAIRNNLTDIQAALNAFISDPSNENVSSIGDLLDGVTASSNPDITSLLAMDQVLIASKLSDVANNFNNAQSAVENKSDERNLVLNLANTAKAAADSLEQTYADNFQQHIDDIEAAYADTRDTETGIYALRVKINDEYAKLDLAGDLMSESQKEHLLTSQGFLLRLPRGEKVLSDSISYSGSVLFSTFSPRGESVSECGADTGVGRTYGLNLRTAEGIFAKEIAGKVSYIRSQTNKQAGIPPTPVIIITEGECEGPSCDKPDCEGPFCTAAGDNYITPSYWRESR